MRRNRRLRRGIYLLPTLFTVGNLFCGFSAVVQASMGRFDRAALLIILAGVLDGLDGRIARMTGSTSEFGLQFDSLADIVSFGVAPAFLTFAWTLRPLNRVGWLIAFLFVICAAMRLARFNIQRNPVDKRYFVGLPSPSAAGAVACGVYPLADHGGQLGTAAVAGMALVAVALLMVSRLRYRSFKDIDLHNRRSYIFVLPLAAVLAAILIRPEIALPIVAGAYLLSGPLAYLWGLSRHRRDVEATAGEVLDEPSVR